MPPYGPHSATCWSSTAPHFERTAISPAAALRNEQEAAAAKSKRNGR